jgi:hypothetical protein
MEIEIKEIYELTIRLLVGLEKRVLTELGTAETAMLHNYRLAKDGE